jgi:uncharacterized protein Yka (UPF0111/DUF47 family)
MAFSLIPRELKFFDLFDEAAAILTRASERFRALLGQFDRLAERAYEIREDENACAGVVERLRAAVGESFVTPFDRENIHALAISLEEVVDRIEEATARFEVFRIERPTDEAVVLGRIIHDCCTHLAEGVRQCRDMSKAERIAGHVREVVRLKGEVDRIYRECDSVLFAAPPADVLLLIKWRELYGALRDVVKSCRRAATALSEVVIKGS